LTFNYKLRKQIRHLEQKITHSTRNLLMSKTRQTSPIKICGERKPRHLDKKTKSKSTLGDKSKYFEMSPQGKSRFKHAKGADSQIQFYTEVFSWGSDLNGQLGLGAKTELQDDNFQQKSQMNPIPRFCSFNVTIRQIACGSNHSVFVTCKV
jgi:alpha-tubulin suppressor-like RCC1 family protein